MATIALPNRISSGGAVAPRWHTSLLVGFFLLIAAAGALLQHRAASSGGFAGGNRPDLSLTYLSMIAAEFGLVAFVYRSGLRRTGTTVGDLIGCAWVSPKDIAIDLLLAAATWALWQGIARLIALVPGGGHAASVSPLLPVNAHEALLWIGLSASAGFAEELVFRGYLQRQLTAYTGRVPVALLLQVCVFAVAHGYQGVRNCIVIAIYGALFTALALWRKSLRPGMLAHAWTDIASGLLR